MESNKFLDLDKYKKKTIVAETPKSSSKTPKQSMNALDKEILIKAADGRENTTKTWFSLLNDGESLMVHCPITPEAHSNMDANASCSMRKVGNTLQLKCFGCEGKASIKILDSKNDSGGSGTKKLTYSIPEFNKEDAQSQVARGLNDISSIAREFIRLLPPLIKEEINNDK